MNLATNKILILMLVLLVLTSQSIAAVAMSCKSEMTTTAMTMTMDEQQHSLNDHNASSADCEEQDCHCPVGSCSAVVLPATSGLNTAAISSTKITQALFQLTQTTLTAIYHPPATC